MQLIENYTESEKQSAENHSYAFMIVWLSGSYVSLYLPSIMIEYILNH